MALHLEILVKYDSFQCEARETVSAKLTFDDRGIPELDYRLPDTWYKHEDRYDGDVEYFCPQHSSKP